VCVCVCVCVCVVVIHLESVLNTPNPLTCTRTSLVMHLLMPLETWV